ncbi:host-nuclease inhibitor Gam family protein [Thalassomonas viridans]|uniref:Host-nuclease inhibitor Gam family protein n=1 Tax=Thalassomonas viridans TaxID=137584 RepID=A0AAE9Z8Y5_9GAMM|nr:host-nuclease inhibitor Gam family protein [Thalassomonas viridans]WDE07262.1 host-nuclease inhibitor Gam family protein [Thalassomonas viridans]
MTKKRIKSTNIEACSTREEAEKCIGDIGLLQRQVTGIESAMNDELAAIKQKYEEQAKPLNEQIYGMFMSVQAYCSVNRDSLLKNNTKTAKLTTGEVSWRTTPKKVTVRGAEAVMKSLKALGLERFIRTKEEIDKNACLNEQNVAENVPGISFSQKEEFVIRPFESEIERAETVS